MTNKAPARPAPESGGLNLGEIYYVLFRRKWLILLCSLIGVAAAAGFFFLTPKLYESRTSLLVRYILENKGIEAATVGDQVRSPDSAGVAIVNSEIAILASFDLARQVAEAFGPEKVLPKGGANPSAIAAAGFIKANLVTDTARNSSVIGISFQHPDPEVAQKVLALLVETYLKKHVEIHGARGFVATYLTQQRDKCQKDLTDAEKELRDLRNKIGLVSIEDSRKLLIEQVTRIRHELLAYEADSAERQIMLQELQTVAGTKPATNEVVVWQELPLEKVEEYRRALLQIEVFRRREQDLLSQFTESNSLVKKTHQLVVEAGKAKDQMEEEFPALKQVNISLAAKPEKTIDLAAEKVRMSALQARIGVRKNQLEQTQTNLAAVELIEPELNRLQSRRNQYEARLRDYQANLDSMMLNTTMGSGSIPNINVVQEASPASLTTSKLKKKVGMALAGGIGGGLGLAFLIEVILRQSIRHSSQVEKKLGLPLFISIPKFGRNGSSRSRKARRTESLRRNGARAVTATASDAESAQIPGDLVGTRSPGGVDLAVAEWDGSHQLRSYYEALRDRLITFFEVGNMTHKPKLVAVTGCSKGAGVSSVAAGLAATLSETGEGNVLLVDMNLEHGAAHPYFHGKPAIGITNAFDAKDRQSAHVQENLYAVSASVMNEALPKALPKRFASLVPRFKASDYDYIIFDMPPVTQTSLTPRLASYMDMVLLVLEAEKTNLGVADKAVELLRESHANVAAVLNRKRKFVPAWLLEEF